MYTYHILRRKTYTLTHIHMNVNRTRSLPIKVEFVIHILEIRIIHNMNYIYYIYIPHFFYQKHTRIELIV